MCITVAEFDSIVRRERIVRQILSRGFEHARGAVDADDFDAKPRELDGENARPGSNVRDPKPRAHELSSGPCAKQVVS